MGNVASSPYYVEAEPRQQTHFYALWALKTHISLQYFSRLCAKQITVKCVLELGATVKDKSDSIRFLVLCQF